jgi:hypothetical protein
MDRNRSSANGKNNNTLDSSFPCSIVSFFINILGRDLGEASRYSKYH